MPENYFFDMGTNIDSYDSRYTGLVSKDDVKAVAIPLF
ncbi:S26 family signal peptidase [Desulfosarcina sp. BuS5]